MSATDRSSSRVQLVLKMMTNGMSDSTFAFVPLLLLRLLSAALMPTSSQLLWDLRPGGSGDGIRTRPRWAAFVRLWDSRVHACLDIGRP